MKHIISKGSLRSAGGLGAGTRRRRIGTLARWTRPAWMGGIYTWFCLSSFATDFRWAASSNRIYVDGPGSATLSDIKAALPSAPLTLLDPVKMVWYSGADLIVESNAQLKLYGPTIGGDVTELRLKSDNVADSNAVVELRADWGWLDIRNTKITSWDSAANGPDTETDTYSRAFIHARSTLDADGKTAHESRMDVINSEICYLGSHDTEAYGLVWKVVDTTATNLPPSSTNALYDLVKVYGDILGSHLHHNYFGAYSYGQSGGQWNNNEVDNNIGYGFDPHNYSDDLDIENNSVHDNGWHGIIASIGCARGILRSNVVWNNGRNGIMLHRSSDNWIIQGNQSSGNADSGIAIFASAGALVSDNLCVSNGNAGIRLSVGAADNIISNNIFGHCGQYGVSFYKGTSAPNPGDDGRVKRNAFVNNQVYDYAGDALKIEEGDANSFIGNTFTSPGGTTLLFVNCSTTLIASNLLPADAQAEIFGSLLQSNVVSFIGEPQVGINLDTFSMAKFSDGSGAIFDTMPGNHLPTTASPTGSLMLVTSANLGGTAATVSARKLFIVPQAGTMEVTPVSWSSDGSQSKSWTIQAGGIPTSATCTVGDLTPGTAYTASAAAGNLATIVANLQGFITFTADNDGVPDTLIVSPANSSNVASPVFLSIDSAAANTVLITWPASAGGWMLQQNNSLGTTNWTANTNDVRLIGQQNQVEVPVASANNFFRLFHP